MLAAAALTALPLAWRRLYPITAWLVIIAAIVIVQQDFVPKVALGTAVYAAYSAIAYSRYRNLAIAVVSLATVTAAAEFGARFPQFQFPGRLTAIFVVLPAAAAGLGIRELRRRLADSTARLRRAAAEAAAATERALAAERARIAAELHDVVTHNVSVMIVQAGAARKILASSPPDAETALLAVEATGRDAMAELRNLLGLLSPSADGREAAAAGPRPGGEDRPAALLPQPGLGELDALIGRVSAAGLPVELRVSGACRPLSPGADLAAYRVVQEGLTNVLRHAGRAAATVGVEWGEQLVITVSDDGPGSGPGDGTTAAAPAPRVAGCSGCASGWRSTAVSSPRGRGLAAAGRYGRSCRREPGHDRRRGGERRHRSRQPAAGDHGGRRRPGAGTGRLRAHPEGGGRRRARRGRRRRAGGRGGAPAPARRRADGHPDAAAGRHRGDQANRGGGGRRGRGSSS